MEQRHDDNASTFASLPHAWVFTGSGSSTGAADEKALHGPGLCRLRRHVSALQLQIGLPQERPALPGDMMLLLYAHGPRGLRGGRVVGLKARHGVADNAKSAKLSAPSEQRLALLALRISAPPRRCNRSPHMPVVAEMSPNDHKRRAPTET